MNYLRMDLKVCEGCGALWLRMSVTKDVYCRSCAAKLAEFPAPRVEAQWRKADSAGEDNRVRGGAPAAGGAR